jgi:hypothetical protein
MMPDCGATDIITGPVRNPKSSARRFDFKAEQNAFGTYSRVAPMVALTAVCQFKFLK